MLDENLEMNFSILFSDNLTHAYNVLQFNLSSKCINNIILNGADRERQRKNYFDVINRIHYIFFADIL